MSGYDLLSPSLGKHAEQQKKQSSVWCAEQTEKEKDAQKRGSTKSALMTFNSHNTAEDNNAQQLRARARSFKWREMEGNVSTWTATKCENEVKKE